MDWKIFLTVFASVFIAELGDKTQLATMLFAADKEVSRTTVFLAASAALVVASGLGVLAGSVLTQMISEKSCTMSLAQDLSLLGFSPCYAPNLPKSKRWVSTVPRYFQK